MHFVTNFSASAQTMINACRRAAIALHIYVLDHKYHALGVYLMDTDINKAVAEHERRIVLMRRTQACAELNKLGDSSHG